MQENLCYTDEISPEMNLTVTFTRLLDWEHIELVISASVKSHLSIVFVVVYLQVSNFSFFRLQGQFRFFKIHKSRKPKQ